MPCKIGCKHLSSLCGGQRGEHCAVVLQLQVPNSCADLDFTLLQIFGVGIEQHIRNVQALNWGKLFFIFFRRPAVAIDMH